MSNLSELARQAMALARNQIVLRLRFMDMAVFRLIPAPADTTLATEGVHLFYGEKHVLRRYMRFDQQGLSRDYLHALMHCVFRHPFIETLREPALWDLACDIAVTDVILSLEDDRFALPGDEARRAVIEGLRGAVRPMTAEKLYAHFSDQRPEPGWHELFRIDDHVLWHKPKQAREMRNAQPGDEGEGNGEPPKGSAANDASPPQPEGEPPEPSQSPAGISEDREQPNRDEGSVGSEASGASEDSPAAAMKASGDPGDSEDRQSQTLRAEQSDGQTGRSVGKYDENHTSDQRNVGRGMDTEGREGMPAGSQSRNDRTDGGLDAAHGMGISGDSGDAASQSDASESGGSGSGLNDAFLESDETLNSRSPNLQDELRETDREALKREWKDVGERIQTDLETFSRQQGSNAGRMLSQLQAVNREKLDYAAFLRRFTVLGEAAEINHEDFDNIFYTYGLRLYKNMPLIEPLETREVMRVRDFVIAIDTSGSTSGALVKRFLETTWGILKGEENFFKKMNLHIVQCDAGIQEAVHIASQREFDAYMETFSVKGLGGTDFRPVFQYVDDLLRQGAFTRLRGLIYFTDGLGTFPARKPDYETAFVFLPGESEPPQVPAWAIRAVLDDV